MATHQANNVRQINNAIKCHTTIKSRDAKQDARYTNMTVKINDGKGQEYTIQYF